MIDNLHDRGKNGGHDLIEGRELRKQRLESRESRYPQPPPLGGREKHRSKGVKGAKGDGGKVLHNKNEKQRIKKGERRLRKKGSKIRNQSLSRGVSIFLLGDKGKEKRGQKGLKDCKKNEGRAPARKVG